MIDDHEMYINIKQVWFCVCLLLSMLVMRDTYLGVVKTYVFIKQVPFIFFDDVKLYMWSLILTKYIVRVFPLVLSYPLIRITNKYLYMKGYYNRLIRSSETKFRNVVQ